MPPSSRRANQDLSDTFQALSLISRNGLQKGGNSVDEAILLDDDIDHSTPVRQRSERPRVSSIQKGVLPCAEVLSLLGQRGVTRANAAPDGNCAQRSANCSVKEINLTAATGSDSTIMKAIRAQRQRIVDRVTGSGEAVPMDGMGSSIGMSAMREHLGVPAAAMEPFRMPGHWMDRGEAFILFLWGLADDLRVPLAVLHRTADGYADPVCVYRAQPPGAARMRDNCGAFSYVRFNELLSWIDGHNSARRPPVALVDFVPGHYSPFVYEQRSAQRK